MSDYKIQAGVTDYPTFELLKATDMKAPSPHDVAIANRPLTAEQIALAKSLVRYTGPA
ncbi:MAG TPA: hypothetical protein VFW00_07170 [Rhodocyclaceae bacterium]|nr:hypothetical protein [Rhodocyclaceae bacterium]